MWEEREEAVDDAAVALDPHVAGALRVEELALPPEQGRQGLGIGLDDRVRCFDGAVIELDPAIGDTDVERVLAQP